MAYKASWIAPLGSLHGGYNSPQKARNKDNLHETFRKNETEGYFKPPFCQWPFGGSTKKETKYRIKSGEPVVKAGSYEYERPGEEFYYGIGKHAAAKDDDEISIRTVSTTLYMQSNLCTRTFGPHRKPKRFPEGKSGQTAKPQRARYFRRPLEKEYVLTDDMKKKLASRVDLFDTVHYDDRSPRRQATDGIFCPNETSKCILTNATTEKDLQVATLRPVLSRSQSLKSSRTRLPRPYQSGLVPRFSDREVSEEPPAWRKDALSRSARKILVSPRTYLTAKDNVTKKNKEIEDLFEENDQVIFFDED